MPPLLLLLVTLLLHPPLLLGAQSAPAPAEATTTERAAAASPLFSTNEILEITLRTDMRALFRDRDSLRREQHRATAVVANPEGGATEVQLNLRTRGHYRRQASVCTTPPIQMRFRGRASRGTPFEGQRNLKLVVQCRERDDYEQYVLREYLVYRTFNLLSERSFNARLIRLTWEDAAGRVAARTEYAFVIESEEELAKRLEGHILEQKGATDDDLDPHQTALVDLFQYMVGNTDWSIRGLHNIRLLWYKDVRPPFPVPYDFDWTGVVEARYASPDMRLPITNVRQRLYRGKCRSPEEFAPVAEIFRQRRGEIEDLWRNAVGLDDRSRRRALDYFNDFYRVIDDRNTLRREINVDCRRG